jgi:hypothetical protein
MALRPPFLRIIYFVSGHPTIVFAPLIQKSVISPAFYIILLMMEAGKFRERAIKIEPHESNYSSSRSRN